MEKVKTIWIEKDGCLNKTFKFKNFVAAVDFVNKIVPIAEAKNHHPDLLIHSYNQVKISLKTHDKNAITQKDHALASDIDGLVG